MTIDEIYFLVRVGSWDQQQLENYINGRIDDAVYDASADLGQDTERAYHDGHEAGRHAGYQDGRHDGYEDGYASGVREGESNARHDDRW